MIQIIFKYALVNYHVNYLYFLNFITDTDECAAADTNDCSQNCNNLDCLSGRYQCSCNSGFRLGVDNHTCIGKMPSFNIFSSYFFLI